MSGLDKPSNRNCRNGKCKRNVHEITVVTEEDRQRVRKSVEQDILDVRQKVDFWLNSRGKTSAANTKKISTTNVTRESVFRSRLQGNFNPNHKVKIIVHGWRSSPGVYSEMMEALLDANQPESVNVVRVDWVSGAWAMYDDLAWKYCLTWKKKS